MKTLIYSITKHKKQSVYNYWKNSVKTGAQTHTITNANAIKTTQEFLYNNPITSIYWKMRLVVL